MIIQHHVVSTRKSPLFIAAMVFFFFVLILIDRTDLISMKTYLGLVGLVLFSLLYYLLGKVKIILDNPCISFQYPLKKDVHIPWPEIIESKLQWDFDMHGGNAYWTFSLLAGKNYRLFTFFLFEEESSVNSGSIDNKMPECPI